MQLFILVDVRMWMKGRMRFRDRIYSFRRNLWVQYVTKNSNVKGDLSKYLIIFHTNAQLTPRLSPTAGKQTKALYPHQYPLQELGEALKVDTHSTDGVPRVTNSYLYVSPRDAQELTIYYRAVSRNFFLIHSAIISVSDFSFLQMLLVLLVEISYLFQFSSVVAYST